MHLNALGFQHQSPEPNALRMSLAPEGLSLPLPFEEHQEFTQAFFLFFFSLFSPFFNGAPTALKIISISSKTMFFQRQLWLK